MIAFNKKDVFKVYQNDIEKKDYFIEKFSKDMMSMFNIINNNFYNYYSETGQVINFDEYKDEIGVELTNNYRLISKDFKNNIQESFIEKINNNIKIKIDNDIEAYTKEQTKNKTNYILNTTKNDNKEVLSAVITYFIVNKLPYNNKSIAEQSYTLLKTTYKNRSNLIATTETQNISEGVKNIEKVNLYNNNVVLDNKSIKDKLKDMWMTNLDGRERLAHNLANGQTKSPIERFNVGGELLRYPGDPTAKIENIVNCRCSLISTIY